MATELALTFSSKSGTGMSTTSLHSRVNNLASFILISLFGK